MRAWDDAQGAVLDDRYEVGARLGRGGSATVHRAWDRERGREVAVKLLPPGTAAAAVRPGRRESDILAALDHPRLVALHDVLVTDEGTALVMELVDGPSLHERLTDGPLPLQEVAVVLSDVAAGLAHAHRRGVVHRDVKPGNVLLRLERGRVVEARLSDFGIARRADATRTTGERTVVGTVRFLSPEQARGERVTAASDVYSLGLTALAAVTGEDAFPGREAESLAGRMLRPPHVPDGLPEDWHDLLLGMTALEPADRIDASAAAALAASLGTGSRPVLAAAGPATQPIDVVRTAAIRRPPRGHRGRLAAAVVGMAVAGAVLGGVIAMVFAPTALQQALSGALPQPPATSAPPAPVASRPAAHPTTVPTSEPTTAAKDVVVDAPPAKSDDHHRHGGSSGKGSSGKGGGHGSGGHGSDD